MSLLLRKVGEKIDVEGKDKQGEKTSKRARKYEDLEPQIESMKTKKRKKDKSKRHVVNFKEMDAEAQRVYLSKVLIDTGTMAEIEIKGLLTRERMYDLQNASRSVKKIAGLVGNVLSLMIEVIVAGHAVEHCGPISLDENCPSDLKSLLKYDEH